MTNASGVSADVGFMGTSRRAAMGAAAVLEQMADIVKERDELRGENEKLRRAITQLEDRIGSLGGEI